MDGGREGAQSRVLSSQAIINLVLAQLLDCALGTQPGTTGSPTRETDHTHDPDEVKIIPHGDKCCEKIKSQNVIKGAILDKESGKEFARR